MQLIIGSIVRGHGVASGCSNDNRFPDGTLSLQCPIFESMGLDLTGYYKATINVSVHPFKPKPIKAFQTFRRVKWHPDCAAEDFSFFEVKLNLADDNSVSGLIYWPHPETKPEHFQDPHVIEIMAPKIQGLTTGDKISFKVDKQQMHFHK